MYICLILHFSLILLQDHPFIMQYDDGNTEVVSMWVCRSLEDRKARQAQRLMWRTVAQDGILGDGFQISSHFTLPLKRLNSQNFV